MSLENALDPHSDRLKKEIYDGLILLVVKIRSISLVIGVVALIASLILILMIFAFGPEGGLGWMGGHTPEDDSSSALSSEEIIVLALAIAMMVSAIGLILFSIFTKSEDKKAPEEVKPEEKETEQTAPPPSSEPQSELEEEAEREQELISRLLDGDEKKLFNLIVENDGVILQKDIVAKGIFSKAKVTRLLDKLENRGLIEKERHGLTNKIRVKK